MSHEVRESYSGFDLSGFELGGIWFVAAIAGGKVRTVKRHAMRHAAFEAVKAWIDQKTRKHR